MQALLLAVTIELEHLLMNHGLHLSTTPASEVAIPDAFLRRLATMLFDVWQRTLPEDFSSAEPACQPKENSVPVNTIADLRSMLAEWRRHHIFIAALPKNE